MNTIKFAAARTTFKAAIKRVQMTGSPIAFREAVVAEIAMQAAAGRTITEDKARELVVFQLNKNYHPFGGR